jgi:hypothetical protein
MFRPREIGIGMINSVWIRHAGKSARNLPVIDAGDNVIPVRNPEWPQRNFFRDLKFHHFSYLE